MPELVPTRRTVIRTAAWSVPAVTVAAAAPAFAVSPTVGPNLSQSRAQDPAPTRFAASNVAVVSPPLFDNATGTAAATGIAMTITSPVAITDYGLQLPFGPANPTQMDAASQGIAVTGLGTTTITVSFDLPFNGFSMDAGEDMTMFVRSVFTFDGSIPDSLDYSVEAANGGTPGNWTLSIP